MKNIGRGTRIGYNETALMKKFFTACETKYTSYMGSL